MTFIAALFGIALLTACASESLAPQETPAGPDRRTEAPAIQPKPQERDLADLSLAAARLQAQIDERVEQFTRYPRKKFIGARAREDRFAQYEDEWRAKIERAGTANYPLEARGKIYGTVRLTVSIRSDGSVESVTIDRSSGHEVLDRGALRIVELASPFAPFPPEIKRDTDLLVITRTWTFTNDDTLKEQ
jgi:protein TonB